MIIICFRPSTRVNRPYKNFRYGYVVDFADIRKEFDATNKAYFDELQAELGDEMVHYSNLFKSAEEIAQEIESIKDILFQFNTENAEIFSQQISEIQDRAKVLAIKKALADARDLYNIIRLQGAYAFLQNLDFQKLNQLYRETSNHLDLLNLKESIESNADTANLLKLLLKMFCSCSGRSEKKNWCWRINSRALYGEPVRPLGTTSILKTPSSSLSRKSGETVQEKEAERSYAGGDDFEHRNAERNL